MCYRVNHNIAKSIVDVRYHSLTIMIEQHFFNNFLVFFRPRGRCIATPGGVRVSNHGTTWRTGQSKMMDKKGTEEES